MPARSATQRRTPNDAKPAAAMTGAAAGAARSVPVRIARRSRAVDLAGSAPRLPRRKPRLSRLAAESVGATAALVPHFGRLFEGVEALGSAPRRSVGLLARAGVGRRHRVLDVGCGKGAVAVAAARELGCRVLGVDALAVFVRAARVSAARAGVADRCRFVVGDVRRGATARGRGHDAAVCLGVLPLEQAAALCRAHTRVGGVYLLDDTVRPRGVPARRGRGSLTRGEAQALIESLGDRVERFVMLPTSAVARQHRRIVAALSQNAAPLARERPALRLALRAFLANQRRAGRLLTGAVRPAMWLVRRGAG